MNYPAPLNSVVFVWIAGVCVRCEFKSNHQVFPFAISERKVLLLAAQAVIDRVSSERVH